MGYAAAVMGRIAARVDTIERHPGLAREARQRLARQGIINVQVHTGDGTLGWPGGAPYDVIVAAAAGPRVPPAWREQLALGGRLVMPLGAIGCSQRLIRLTRTKAAQYDETHLGGVAFVPLIGAQGWSDPAG